MFYTVIRGGKMREVRMVKDGIVYSYYADTPKGGMGSLRWPFTEGVKDFLFRAYRYDWFWGLEMGLRVKASHSTRMKYRRVIEAGDYVSNEHALTLKERQEEFKEWQREIAERRAWDEGRRLLRRVRTHLRQPSSLTLESQPEPTSAE